MRRWGSTKAGSEKKRAGDKTQRGETAAGAEEEAEGGGGTREGGRKWAQTNTSAFKRNI